MHMVDILLSHVFSTNPADILGGVNREHDAGDVKRGWDYFGWGRLVGPQWWW